MCTNIERELVGICKQSMLMLRQQLLQYINELHADTNVDDVRSYIHMAANEVNSVLRYFIGF